MLRYGLQQPYDRQVRVEQERRFEFLWQQIQQDAAQGALSRTHLADDRNDALLGLKAGNDGLQDIMMDFAAE